MHNLNFYIENLSLLCNSKKKSNSEGQYFIFIRFSYILILQYPFIMYHTIIKIKCY